MSTSTIVVGIDGGHASVAALELALEEASLRNAQVRAITCWPADVPGDDLNSLRCNSQESASQVLEQVVAEATRRNPGHVPVVREISQSFAGPTLVAAARNADLLVVGSTSREAGIRGQRHPTIEYCLYYSSTPLLVAPCSILPVNDLAMELGGLKSIWPPVRQRRSGDLRVP